MAWVGYRRVTVGQSCTFCLMLATRGAVYSAESVTFRSHAHCDCGAELESQIDRRHDVAIDPDEAQQIVTIRRSGKTYGKGKTYVYDLSQYRRSGVTAPPKAPLPKPVARVPRVWSPDEVAPRLFQDAPEAGVLKREIAEELASRAGCTYEEADHLIALWAQTSGDSSSEATLMQRLAERVLGIHDAWPGDLHRVTTDDLISMHLLDPARVKGRESFLQAMYDRTQDWFKAAGFDQDDTITLYRGMIEIEDEADWRVGAKRTLQHQPMSSWTTDERAAREFAVPGLDSVVMEAQVKVRDIIGSFRTGYGCMSERELVVKGGRWAATRIG